MLSLFDRKGEFNHELPQLTEMVTGFVSEKNKNAEQFMQILAEINSILQHSLPRLSQPFVNPYVASSSNNPQRTYNTNENNNNFNQIRQLISILSLLFANRPDFSTIQAQQEEKFEEIDKAFITSLKNLLNFLNSLVNDYIPSVPEQINKLIPDNLDNLLKELQNLFTIIDPGGRSIDKQINKLKDIMEAYQQIKSNLDLYLLSKQIKTFADLQEKSSEGFLQIFTHANEVLQKLLTDLDAQLFEPDDLFEIDINAKKINALFQQTTQFMTVILLLIKLQPNFFKSQEQQELEQKNTFITLLKNLLTIIFALLDYYISAAKNYGYKNFKQDFSNLGNLIKELKQLFDVIDPDGYIIDKKKFGEMDVAYHQIEIQSLINEIFTSINQFDPNSHDQLFHINEHLRQFHEVTSSIEKDILTRIQVYIYYLPPNKFIKLKEIKKLQIVENQKDKEKITQQSEASNSLSSLSDRIAGFNEIATLLYEDQERRINKHLETWNNILSFIESELDYELNVMQRRHIEENETTKRKVKAFNKARDKIQQQRFIIATSTNNMSKRKTKLNFNAIKDQMIITNNILDDLAGVTKIHCADAITINSINNFVYYLKSKILEKLRIKAKSHRAVLAMGSIASKRLEKMNNLSDLWQQVTSKNETEKVKEIAYDQITFSNYSLQSTLLEKDKHDKACSVTPSSTHDEARGNAGSLSSANSCPSDNEQFSFRTLFKHESTPAFEAPISVSENSSEKNKKQIQNSLATPSDHKVKATTPEKVKSQDKKNIEVENKEITTSRFTLYSQPSPNKSLQPTDENSNNFGKINVNSATPENISALTQQLEKAGIILPKGTAVAVESALTEERYIAKISL